MARPLQKKKNKSSLHRVRQKPKSKRINIKSNPIVAANWYYALPPLSLPPSTTSQPLTSIHHRDQTQTLSQNYHRLGLSSKLNAPTGGTEYKVSKSNPKSALAIPSSRAPKSLGTEEVKVVRDPETGAIVSVQPSAAESRARRNPLNDPLNDLSDDDEEGFDGLDGEDVRESKGIVPDLEASAAFEKKKRPRLQSERERAWCRGLVDRWGDDWGGMVKDRRLNPMQQSEGELRKRVGLWLSRQSRGEGGRVEDIVCFDDTHALQRAA